MNTQIQTFGHSGRRVDQLKRALEAQDALVFDIRRRTKSHQPEWNDWILKRKLGNRYVAVPELSDQNASNGGPVAIADLPTGLQRIFEATQPVVLMCRCRCWHVCHRRTIAEALQRVGIQTQELEVEQENEE